MSYKGKVIYNPSGKAGEYSYWAANLFNGCSGDCEYCYCKKYPMSQFWSNKPTLKKSIGDSPVNLFISELNKNIDSLKEHGLFFNFSSDPCLKETFSMNWNCIAECVLAGVPVKVLTKQTWWIDEFIHDYHIVGPDGGYKELVSIGFTLTGRDELEPGCATNQERIDGMKELFEAGFKTFASIEPIIDLDMSAYMIGLVKDFCNHFKVGVLSGGKYGEEDVATFIKVASKVLLEDNPDVTIYWKDDTLKAAGMLRKDLPSNCVDRDYKFWRKSHE